MTVNVETFSLATCFSAAAALFALERGAVSRRLPMAPGWSYGGPLASILATAFIVSLIVHRAWRSPTLPSSA